MRIHLVAVGNRMPDWVTEAYSEYAKRLPRECELALKEIAPAKRGKNADIVRLTEDEGERMLAALPRDVHVVALDVAGKEWSTPDLAAALARWLESGRDVALLVGGPDGLSPACLERANQRWSLSKLTFPHPVVRIIVAEQIYRAWSILQHHPYHR
ncbi:MULTISPECIES: 23S rRNA (pseudouridine(1915)-N(3))-methyltransferase RlmH [Methylocaldum]|jgi:23S rRNA (pseudouridine1915-N3)-methyltransferase|uniref:23S rRNA (pseudouridine(1915)-N(3))-methyltransferase RlmH n=1 Tax=unclassified Methylocaldum TaxID=2622260 RepID=UPI000A3276C3|nr:23S rRNA (pseudouridine(1915)-N(3))-methyltransferase RlmH [Methylocaldum sp. RMAD-M]MVF20767.1 23S rRNA (pseudouridine(1915)-N(3))-methyltransferase RlmH [Methylocaldum sp. BRCS4]